VGQKSRHTDDHISKSGERFQQAVHRLHDRKEVGEDASSGSDHHEPGSQGQIAQKGVLRPQLALLEYLGQTPLVHLARKIKTGHIELAVDEWGNELAIRHDW